MAQMTTEQNIVTYINTIKRQKVVPLYTICLKTELRQCLL